MYKNIGIFFSESYNFAAHEYIEKYIKIIKVNEGYVNGFILKEDR
jgi:hypothetical protein